MDTAHTASDAFHRLIDPVFDLLSQEQAGQIAGFHAEAELQDKIQQLAEKANEGELTPDEQAEYEGYAHANRFLAILQAGLRRRTAGDPPVG
ncbi:MAG: hypothetical protein KDA44_21520 [Planctomycetales bacterium]|nr:hypothetical protein [Planctomycetales bacterium]